jgi:hypothetical protein
MMALACSPQTKRMSIMSDDIRMGRRILNHTPYINHLVNDWTNLHTIGVRAPKYPRLFNRKGGATFKLTRKYPPRVIWVTATRQGSVHMGWHFWSQKI